ncbi:hypothetical protein ACFVGY_12660 [Streptomyces sp. NPDC127106]|uniref:hypothetical protein n=1 Tax=Streptomyces sp. NPDC127106 TaxID=3345360 RepID=UPI0036449C96
MIGSLGMAGVGAASADDSKNGTDTTQCTQTATASNTNTPGLVDIPNVDVDVTIAVFGNITQTNVIQQICSGDDSTNANSADLAVAQANTPTDTSAQH